MCAPNGLCRLALLGKGNDALDVAACAKRLVPSTLQHDGVHVGVGAPALVGVVQQVDHVGIERVERFGPVERCNAQALV